ncbi:DUF1435 domain-containing protein [Serratia sp. M24T3]|uniref:DUF1435 domain-containing protein n=1 Tax=Serratia sp. M24T3 TaxID=932213 RepID=UPI00025B9025|nr:DUF1435 domain-containing protein [Serratia sp. M24T3]EIC86589.1 hypothetical protein SPM24T3_00865 [Serratia sp. M24T3]
MIAAIVTACGLWGVSWSFGKRLSSGWGVLLPCALLPVLALANLSLDHLKYLVIIAMLATLIMLFHSKLRHYLLLPSFMALAGGLAAVSVNFNLM